MGVFLNKQKICSSYLIEFVGLSVRLKYFNAILVQVFHECEFRAKAEREFRSAVDVASAELPTAVWLFESDAIYSRVSK